MQIPNTESRIIHKGFIKSIPLNYIAQYFTGKKSLFRFQQEEFFQKYGERFNGILIDIGGEKHYHVERFFPNISKYICTNISRDYDEYQDATNLTYSDG